MEYSTLSYYKEGFDEYRLDYYESNPMSQSPRESKSSQSRLSASHSTSLSSVESRV